MAKNSKERELVKTAYPNKTWYDKVDKMDDGQVMSIYFRLKNQGKI